MRNGDDLPRGLVVEVRNGDINGALRRFKKKVQDSGLLQELRDREFYEKPSIRRKKAKAQARSRWLKKKAQLDDRYGQIQYTSKRK
jgi:small subunit ribosomal protein S21